MTHILMRCALGMLLTLAAVLAQSFPTGSFAYEQNGGLTGSVTVSQGNGNTYNVSLTIGGTTTNGVMNAENGSLVGLTGAFALLQVETNTTCCKKYATIRMTGETGTAQRGTCNSIIVNC